MNNIRFKLAMGQMLVEGGRRDENLRRAVRMVEDAAAQDCRIVVLPQCLDAGWVHPEAGRLAEPPDRAAQRRSLSTAASSSTAPTGRASLKLPCDRFPVRDRRGASRPTGLRDVTVGSQETLGLPG